MKLWMVRGYEDDPEFINLYGVFSTEEKANEIAENLKKAAIPYTKENEEFKVEVIELDKPTELYDFMINN